MCKVFILTRAEICTYDGFLPHGTEESNVDLQKIIDAIAILFLVPYKIIFAD